eukprot:CAMPEP_0180569570 /NCGR_PEP_ID=MMETSP1037_2-20121125/7750_1 /TAXON_ID=632150 /ORGANISM="Azadinium spinosum, Strain 3D9" /LENGTH=388 /DNA_ID=CAMNT_0022586817 /DNA_START=384 /DNA_END=1550 /DNA_ORIENTATION=-
MTFIATKPGALYSRTEPQKYGVASQVDGPRQTLDKADVLKEKISQLTSLFGYFASGLVLIGIVCGLYLGVVLLYFSNRELEMGGKQLPASASLAGFGSSGLFIILLPVLWCLLYFGQRRACRLLDGLAADCKSQRDVQSKMVRLLIEKLRSKEGERYRNMLFEVGVGEEAIERILTAPPENMVDMAIEQLSGIVLAKIVSGLFEEAVTPPFEDMVLMFAIVFVGAPGAVVFLLSWLACFCVTFEVGLASSIITSLSQLALGLMYLRFTSLYAVSCAALNIAMFVTVMITWINDGVTGLSVLCLTLSFPAFCLWFLFVCRLKPLAEAVFEVFKEVDIIAIWRAFGCVRNPEELHQKNQAVVKSGGCIARRLGVQTLLSDIALGGRSPPH